MTGRSAPKNVPHRDSSSIRSIGAAASIAATAREPRENLCQAAPACDTSGRTDVRTDVHAGAHARLQRSITDDGTATLNGERRSPKPPRSPH